ncbi:transposase [Streptomyces sp. NBC_01320]|uniref:transposase n=1 Tax=Streptomyces sp. NBC_01320 TaxID=2903824 RepID=UPI002E0EEB55|nr:transposase [Streptomyces sp. NBC_01320]
MSRIAEELGVNAETLRQWVKKATDTAWHSESSPPAAPAQSAKDTEITRLRRQVRELEMERDILRRAAAKYFAKETNW